MATAALPQDPDLGQLRKQARELQRAVRGGEPTALARVSRWHPEPPAPDRFPLTAAQLVLAREHGFASWARLRRYVKIVTDRAWTPGKPAPADESLADRFLRLACLTYSDDEPADRAAAAQLLAEHPELPRHDLFVAAACADVAGGAPTPRRATSRCDRDRWAARLVAAALPGIRPPRPATSSGRPRWRRPSCCSTPARTRTTAGSGTPCPPRSRCSPACSATASTANPGIRTPSRSPGCCWSPGPIPTTGRPSTTACSAPTTTTSSCSSSTASVATPPAPGIDCSASPSSHPPRCCASCWPGRSRTTNASGSPCSPSTASTSSARSAKDRAPRRRTPIEVALTSGHRELADLLTAPGRPATSTRVRPTPSSRPSWPATPTPSRTPLADVVEAVRRKRTGLVTWAAAQGAPNAVELLVSVGFDVNARGRSDVCGNQPWHTALHVAAEKGDLVLARTLLNLGADPNIPDKRYQSTPSGLGPLLRPTRGRRPARTGDPWRIPHWQK